jgi:hypothetical protein
LDDPVSALVVCGLGPPSQNLTPGIGGLSPIQVTTAPFTGPLSQARDGEAALWSGLNDRLCHIEAFSESLSRERQSAASALGAFAPYALASTRVRVRGTAVHGRVPAMGRFAVGWGDFYHQSQLTRTPRRLS